MFTLFHVQPHCCPALMLYGTIHCRHELATHWQFWHDLVLALRPEPMVC